METCIAYGVPGKNLIQSNDKKHYIHSGCLVGKKTFLGTLLKERAMLINKKIDNEINEQLNQFKT